MTNSNLVGCSTGRSAGFSPLRMRPDVDADLAVVRDARAVAHQAAGGRRIRVQYRELAATPWSMLLPNATQFGCAGYRRKASSQPNDKHRERANLDRCREYLPSICCSVLALET